MRRSRPCVHPVVSAARTPHRASWTLHTTRARGRSPARREPSSSVNARAGDARARERVIARDDARAVEGTSRASSRSMPAARALADAVERALERAVRGAGRGRERERQRTRARDGTTLAGEDAMETEADGMTLESEIAREMSRANADAVRTRKREEDVVTRVTRAAESAREAMRRVKASRGGRGDEHARGRRAVDELAPVIWETFQSVLEGLLESTSSRSRHRRALATSCREVVSRFASRDNGIVTDEVLDVSEEYNASAIALRSSNNGEDVSGELLVRLLDDFELTRFDPTSDARHRLIKFREELFEDPDILGSLRVRGRLRAVAQDGLRPDMGEEDRFVEVELSGIVDYQYSFTAPIELRGFYVVTPFALYKLMNPKSTYAMLYDESFQMRYDLARRTARALARSARTTFESILPQLVTRLPTDVSALQIPNERDQEGETWTKYSETDVLSCKTTICNLCLNELSHLNRRSAGIVASLTKKASHGASEALRNARDEYVMCQHANVGEVREDELVRIYGECGYKSCADARSIAAAENLDQSAPLTEWIESTSERFQMDSCLVDEALMAWHFCAEHADFLRLPMFSYERLMRALTSPPSKASWSLFRDVHCALAAQVNPQASVMSSIVLESRPDPSDPMSRPLRVAKFDSELHVHAWPEVVRNLIDRDVDAMYDVKLAAHRASILLKRTDYFQLTPRMRLATISALIALTLKQQSFRKYISERRSATEAQDGSTASESGIDAEVDVMSTIRTLEAQCKLVDGYAHLSESPIKDHPNVTLARSEVFHFLQISSAYWRKYEWLTKPVVTLMKQCQNSSFAELRVILWNFEVTMYKLRLLESKPWENCRQIWRANLCAARTPAQLATSTYNLLSHLPVL